MISIAEKNIRDILSTAIQYSEAQKAVVVFDERCALAISLTEAYRRCLPKAKIICFEKVASEAVLAALASLAPSDLAVLIQSTNFRLDAFRIRVELFNRGIKVIEHPHLSSMRGDLQTQYYMESLAYDASYYRGVGRALKSRLDRARLAAVDSGEERLLFESGFEPAKLNAGDYSDMKNIGGQFPIGEVFTEAKDLESVNGSIRIFAFGDTSFQVRKPKKPILLKVVKGRVVEVADSDPEFDRVLENIRADEGEVWLRELGFGLNRAFTEEKIVSDVGTYERIVRRSFIAGRQTRDL